MARKKKENFEDPEKRKPDFPEVVETMENDILSMAEDYINSLNDPDRINKTDGIFVDMLKKIYRYYLKDILKNSLIKNNNKYDIVLLNDIFNIYTELVYKYKCNAQPNILEFCVFCHIDKYIISNIRYGISNNNNSNSLISYRDISPEQLEDVKLWFIECENALVNGKNNGNPAFDIFKLKAMYSYNDNLAAVPVEMQSGILSAAELPDLSSLHKTRIADNSSPSSDE